ncbi:hypothetical protein QJS10_CPA09g02019 [Acorus calamus]|uniref:Uncharacterized protein n=1 Tax=Acorus calamus TaxID=4465 RepID=A0AAV9E5F0_ACOCL|nr:hypothetical protein QJS10_CPA09g02019 [Acorus calamus]
MTSFNLTGRGDESRDKQRLIKVETGLMVGQGLMKVETSLTMDRADEGGDESQGG